MAKRVRITSDALNSYGTRVLTAGMNIEQYEKNPVLLYMHQRGQVIGYLKDIRTEDGGITAELVFDEASELSKQCKKQWDFGSLKMVSVGIDIIEMSEDAEMVVAGQTSPTITKSKLFEVSVVDIGANDEAIVLRKDGKLLTLGQGEYPLPKLSDKREKPKKPKEMELKTLALQMGLPETADEAAVGAKIAELLAKEKENEQLVKEKSEMELAGVISAVESAIAEKKIGADKKEHFVNLGKSVGIETLQATFAAMSPAVKLTEALAGGGSSAEVKTYSKFSEVPADELKRLRKENAAEYKRLYRAEYGYECEI
jgi:HK97 family phage prohead protease